MTAICVCISIKDGKVCSQKTLGKTFECFGKVEITDETHGFGLDFVEMAESGSRIFTLNMGAIPQRRKSLVLWAVTRCDEKNM